MAQNSDDLMHLHSVFFSRAVIYVNKQHQPILSKEMLWAEIERHFLFLSTDDAYVMGIHTTKKLCRNCESFIYF